MRWIPVHLEYDLIGDERLPAVAELPSVVVQYQCIPRARSIVAVFFASFELAQCKLLICLALI